ncbi:MULTISPECIES: VOC family protein [unclassified Pseudonocardia]|uniref:VOC family protein n=1 Tax=unclassified Pseudonocardia TaxID=2619320 RepID=UPI001CF7022F|nr:VOC family protein [Pseudonocardia sp. ICBG601]
MALSLDIITLGAAHPQTANAFYTAAFSPTTTGDGLDLHGTGRLTFRPVGELAGETGTDPATSGFRGYVLSAIVNQPDEVEALLDLAIANGATVVKPAKKKLFGEFTAVYRAPDGALWKLAAATKKNTRPVPDPIAPTETAIYLGVTKPTASKTFYEALGMRVERDYGDTFIDFTITHGVCRLGLLPRKALAKDAGVDAHGDGFSAAMLTHTAASRDDLDGLLKAADAAGGTVTAPATRTDEGDHVARLTDPDGFHWKITAPA